jgi:hypothetical protein
VARDFDSMQAKAEALDWGLGCRVSVSMSARERECVCVRDKK